MTQRSSHFSMKNPAAVSQVRSFSSLDSSTTVGNFARGGQVPSTEPSPFARAIVSYTKDRLRVDFTKLTTFANSYASSMPSKMRKFKQADVLVAYEIFNQPSPQSAQQPAPQPSYHESKRDKLIRDLCKHGIGALHPCLQETFKNLKIMHQLCFRVEGLDNAMLKRLQSSLCTRERGVLLGVIAIHKDHSAENSDCLKLSMFKQSMKNGGKYINRDANDITIVCVICHGSRKFVIAQGDAFEVPDHLVQTAETMYSSGNERDGLIKVCVAKAAHMDYLMDKQFANDFIPWNEDCFAYKSSEHDPAFEAFVVNVMKEQGCVQLPYFSKPTAPEMHASSAEVASEAPVEALMISCHHGNCVKSFDGKYESCQSCLSNPGKDTIVDGWGNVVGYHKPL
jgi:hypothetical protein